MSSCLQSTHSLIGGVKYFYYCKNIQFITCSFHPIVFESPLAVISYWHHFFPRLQRSFFSLTPTPHSLPRMIDKAVYRAFLFIFAFYFPTIEIKQGRILQGVRRRS